MAGRTYLSTEEALKRIESETKMQSNKALTNFLNNVDSVIESKKKDFWDYLAIFPAVSYNLMKGIFDGVVSAGQTIFSLYVNALNDAQRVGESVGLDIKNKDNEDYESETGERLGYLFKNFGITLVEGLVNTGVSIAGNVSRSWGSDDWAFGEGGVIEDVSNIANSVRVSQLQGTIPNTNINDENNNEKNKEILSNYWYDGYEETVRGSVAVQNWIKSNITDPTASFLANANPMGVAGITHQRAENAFADSEFFNAAMSSFESIGNILVSMALSKMGTKAGMSAAQAGLVSQAYFASTVFGKSFQEAINNGASINDAYTYATSNALMETALENLGGFTPSGSSGVFSKISSSNWGTMLSNFVEEGLEEIGSAYGGTGLSYYSNENNEIDQKSDSDFYSEVLFSFLGGAFSSMALSSGNIILNQNNLSNKTMAFDKVLKNKVDKIGEDKAISVLNKKVEGVLNSLNSETTIGTKTNAKGAKYTGIFNQEDKIKYLKNTGLDNYITFDEKQNKYVLIEKQGVKNGSFTTDIFKNKVGNVVVDSSKYYVSDSVKGIDISSDQEVIPMTIDKNDTVSQKVIEVANKKNVPVVIFEDFTEQYKKENNIKDESIDFYYPEGDTIFINRKSLTEENAEEIVMLHETVHALSRNNLNDEVKNLVESFVTIKMDDSFNIVLEYKNKKIEKIFEKTNIEKNITNSFKNYFRQMNKLEQKVAYERAMEMAVEENIAYFVERMLYKDNLENLVKELNDDELKNVIDFLDKKEIKNAVKENKMFANKLNKLSKVFNTQMNKWVEARNTIEFFVDMVYGERYDIAKTIKPEILKKYTAFEVFLAIDWETRIITLDGQEYEFSDIFIEDILKDVKPHRITYPDRDKIQGEFKYNANKNLIYRKLLRDFLAEYENVVEQNYQYYVKKYNGYTMREVYAKAKKNHDKELMEEIRNAVEYLNEKRREASIAEYAIDLLSSKDIYINLNEIQYEQITERFQILNTTYSRYFRKDNPAKMKEIGFLIEKKDIMDIIRDVYTDFIFSKSLQKYRLSTSGNKKTIEIVALQKAVRNIVIFFNKTLNINGWKNYTYSTGTRSGAYYTTSLDTTDEQTAKQKSGELLKTITLLLETSKYKQLYETSYSIAKNEEGVYYVDVLVSPTQEHFDSMVEKIIRNNKKRTAYVNSLSNIFPDSVATDENGNIMDVYGQKQATINGDYVFYDDKTYTGAKTNKYYNLNMINPLDFSDESTAFKDNEPLFKDLNFIVKKYLEEQVGLLPEKQKQLENLIEKREQERKKLSIEFQIIKYQKEKFEAAEPIEEQIRKYAESKGEVNDNDPDSLLAKYEKEDNYKELLEIHRNIISLNKDIEKLEFEVKFIKTFEEDATVLYRDTVTGNDFTLMEILLNKKSINYLKLMGYDGIIHKDFSKETGFVYRVFDEDQIAEFENIEEDKNTKIDMANDPYVKLEEGFNFTDKQQVKIIEPDFVNVNDAQRINKALEDNFVVAAYVPINYYNSFNQQKNISSKAKLIYNEKIGYQLFEIGNKKRSNKIAFQIWVNKDNPFFIAEENLRLDKNLPISHPDLKVITLSGHQERLEKAQEDFKNKDEQYVVYFDMNLDKFITKRKISELKLNDFVMIIEPKNKNAEEILKKIDFEKVFNNGSTIRKGFGIQDLYEEFDIQKSKFVSKQANSIKMQRNAVEIELTAEEKESLKNVTDRYTKEFFERDAKTGKLRISSSRISSRVFEKQKINYYDNKNKLTTTYDNDTYAFNTNVNFENELFNVNSYSEFPVPVKKSEMNEAEWLLFNAFATTEMSFIFYRGKRTQYGFTYSTQTETVTFINTAYLDQGADTSNINFMAPYLTALSGTIIHENTHKMYAFNQEETLKLAKVYRNILFGNSTLSAINKSEIYKNIDLYYQKVKGGTFLEYMRFSYSSAKGMTEADFLGVLDKIITGKKLTIKDDSLLNEVIAQLTGTIMADKKVFTEILKGKPNEIIPFLSFYSSLLTNPNVSQNEKDTLKILYQEFGKLFQSYLDVIKKKFVPFAPKKLYKLADLNKFIKDFSEGRYSTKGELLQEYLKEKSQKTYGVASELVDNIIYISSIFAKTVQQSEKAFSELAEEFKNFKNISYKILENQDAILLLDKMSNNFKAFSKFHDKIRKFDVDAFTADMFNDYYDLFLDMLEDIKRVPDEFRDYFGFPEMDQIETIFDNYLTALTLAEATIFSDQNASVEDFIKATDRFMADLVKSEFMDALNFNADDYWKKLSSFMVQHRKSEIDKITRIIKEKNKNANEAIRNKPIQKESSYKQDLRNINENVANIVRIISENWNDLYKMSVALKAELESLENNIKQADKFKKMIPDLNEDGTLKYDENGEVVLTLEEVELYDKIFNLLIPSLYEQFAYLVQDVNFLTDRYPKEIRYQNKEIGEIVKKFNDKKVANILGNILKAFQTEYTSALSENGETLDDYAAKTSQEMIKAKANKDQIDTKKLSKYSRVMTIQDFLMIFREIFKGEVSFFEDFYREYVRAAFRRSDILMDFDTVYNKWRENNPDLQAHSLEVLETSFDPNFLAQVSMSSIGDIHKEVREQKEKFQETLKPYNEKIREYSKQMADNNARIKDLNEIINKTPPKTAIEKTLKKERRTLYEQNKILRRNIKEQKEKIKSLKNNPKYIESFDYKFQLRYKVAEQNKKMPNFYQPTRGELIALYLSVKREIEMLELYENRTNTDEIIYPTNHFDFGQEFRLFDVKTMIKDGFEQAKNTAVSFLILTEDKNDLLAYLEGLLNEKDWQIINFAKQRFDANYKLLDEEYFKKYQVHLPKQSIYIPFTSLDSDPTREFKLKKANRTNVGVAAGLVMETTLGANTILRIENIFNSIEQHTAQTANYSFERVITSFQNLWVNNSGGSTMSARVSADDTVFGIDNNIYNKIERSLINILKYGEVNESKFTKVTRRILRNTVGATMALNVPSMLKQFPSITTIALKNGVNWGSIVLNTFKSLSLKSKYRDWLMRNNSNFYWRAKFGNIPNLSEQISPMYWRTNLKWTFGKITDTLSRHIGWVDNAIIVGAFVSFVEKIQKDNPNISETEAFEKANEMLTEVLLFGVANTDPAFRSEFSNSKEIYEMIASKFQSENVLQISAIIRDLYLRRNNVKGAGGRFLRDFLALFFSSLFTAIVSSGANYLRGYTEEDELAFDFFVNEFLWGNMVGMLPYYNQISNMLRFDQEKFVDFGFDPNFPGYSDFAKIIDQIVSMTNGENVGRKALKALEVVGNMLGIPVKNASKIVSTASRLIGKQGSDEALAISRFMYSETKTIALNKAIKNNDEKVIESYVEDIFSNRIVSNEISRVLSENPNSKIYFYNDKSYFEKIDENGERIKHEIPTKVRDKYKVYTQNALRTLFTNRNYRRLSGENKVKTIQRIINYYYNFMKEDILNELGDKKIDDMKAVVERAIYYGLKA